LEAPPNIAASGCFSFATGRGFFRYPGRPTLHDDARASVVSLTLPDGRTPLLLFPAPGKSHLARDVTTNPDGHTLLLRKKIEKWRALAVSDSTETPDGHTSLLPRSGARLPSLGLRPVS